MSGGKFELANLYPTPGQRHQAAALASLMICGCVLTLPLLDLHLLRADALALVVDTALATFGLIVATLLFLQFAVARVPSLLVLACGFLLLALSTVPQVVREAAGVPPDLRQQFMADLALALAAIAYSLLRHPLRGSVTPDRQVTHNAGAWLFGGIAATASLAALATWITAADFEPGLAANAVPVAWRVLTTSALVVLFGIAMAPLWLRRASVLDLWLRVALTAWLIDVLMRGLAADESTFGWHLGGLYGLLGAACMMLALLAENATLYSRLTRLLGIRGALRSRAAVAHAPSGEARFEELANELNQPLCAITANADAITRLLERTPADLREVRAALADIIADAGRASDTVRSARRLEADVVDMNQLVDECVEQLRAELSSRRIACEVQIAEPLPAVRGARHELLELLVNLVRHSLDAMARVQHREHLLRVTAQPHDSGVAICVEDSGEGIPSRTESRLALCHDIVSAHGGRFTMMAGAAGGASFQVILPGS